MTGEITVDDNNYRIGNLNAIQQFHVARRLAPIIAKLGKEATTTTAEGATLNINDMFSTIAGALSELSDDECNYILRTCMSIVTREQGAQWVPVWNRAADQPQFADITLPALMQLTMEVIQSNLAPFMNAPQGAGTASATTTPSIR